MLLESVSLVAGIALLVCGGESLVQGSVALAKRLNLSALFIGIAVIGFGTSMPEFVVCVIANHHNQPDMALANIMGSNVANLLLILGSAAVICPLTTNKKMLQQDGSVVFGSGALLLALSYYGNISRLTGLLLVLVLVAYLIFSCRQSRSGQEDLDQQLRDISGTWLKDVFFILLGFACLMIGSNILVKSAVAIAQKLGVSEAVIGLTLIAVGTSLPELATSCIAAYRKRTDIIIGSVLGSNIFNTIGIIGMTAVVKPLPIHFAELGVDLYIMLVLTALVLFMLLTNWMLSRFEGFVCLLIYGGYMAELAFR